MCNCVPTLSHIYLHNIICVCALQFSRPDAPVSIPNGVLAGLDENALRDTFRVEFIAPDGSVESGVDGGGLFKAPGVGRVR